MSSPSPCSSQRYRIGYALSPKNVQSFTQNSLINEAKQRGIDLIKIDPTKPLTQQGPFDCVIHKLVGSDWNNQLRQLSLYHPNVVVIDSLECIERMHSRIRKLDVVTSLKFPQGNQTFGVPNQRVLVESENRMDLIEEAGLKFPLAAKLVTADGSAMSYEMAPVFIEMAPLWARSGGRAGGGRGGGGRAGRGGGGGGRAGRGRGAGGRNGGGENGNQRIGGGPHGGGDGNDGGNYRGDWAGYIEGENRLAEMLLFMIAQMIGTLQSLDIHGLPGRARIYRAISLGFNSVAVFFLSASIGQRRTNPGLSSILSWIGSFATLLGFISMIGMAFSASLIP